MKIKDFVHFPCSVNKFNHYKTVFHLFISVFDSGYLLKWACWTVLTSAAKLQTGSRSSSASPFLSEQRQSHYPFCRVWSFMGSMDKNDINLSAQQLWYPRAGRHAGLPHRPPSRVGLCRRPSEPRRREAAQRGSEEEQDFAQSYSACPALYWAKEELHYAATHRVPWRGLGMGWDPGKDRWKKTGNMNSVTINSKQQRQSLFYHQEQRGRILLNNNTPVSERFKKLLRNIRVKR